MALEKSTSKPRLPTYLAAFIPMIASALLILRISLQGVGPAYSQNKQFWVPDPVKGWTLLDEPVFTTGWRFFGDPSGLNALLFPLGVIGVAAIGLGILIAVLGLRWFERRKDSSYPWLHRIIWAGAVSTMFFPAYALTRPLPPAGAKLHKPALQGTSSQGFAGTLSAPQGTYKIVQSKHNNIVAQVSAGGESFDAIFSGVTGSLTADPGALGENFQGSFAADPGTVTTGISLRDKHAAEALHADKFKEIRVNLEGITSTSQVKANEISFAAKGSVTLAGDKQSAQINGSAKLLDEQAKSHLQLSGAQPMLLVQAELTVSIKGTKVDDGETFDSTDIPVSATLVLALN